MGTRLPLVSVELSERLRAAPPDRRLAVAVVACELATRAAGLDGALAELGLAALRKGDADPTLACQFEAVAAASDEVYFKLDEEGRRDLSLQHFYTARAAAAFASCLKGGVANLEEGIYEAAESRSDLPATVIAAAFAALAVVPNQV